MYFSLRRSQVKGHRAAAKTVKSLGPGFSNSKRSRAESKELRVLIPPCASTWTSQMN